MVGGIYKINILSSDPGSFPHAAFDSIRALMRSLFHFAFIYLPFIFCIS